MGTFGCGSTRNAGTTKQWNLDRVIPIPQYPQAAARGIELGNGKDSLMPVLGSAVAVIFLYDNAIKG